MGEIVDFPKENEVKVYTVAVGNFPKTPIMPKGTRLAIEYIQSLEGFIGFYPCPPKGTLCLFKTENDAKRAKNLMESKDIVTGNNICTCYVDKEYIK